MLKVVIVMRLYGENIYMKNKSIILLILCIGLLLTTLIFSGCNDMPKKEEVERILALSDPVIEGALSSAYGFTAGKDYLSDGHVTRNCIAEYGFEINGSKYKAFVDIYSPEITVYSDYYNKEFEDLLKGKILDSVNGVDIFSGCEYDVNLFSFRDSTPGKYNLKFLGTQMFPTFVTPDNLDEYLTSFDKSPLNINLVLTYYGPADLKVSEEKVKLIWKDFYPTQDVEMDIYHYEEKNSPDFKNFIEEYHLSSQNSYWGHTEYTYFDLTDGVILRSPYAEKSGFEYFADNNSLYIKADYFIYQLFISDERISQGDNYTRYYIDTKGKKQEITESWYDTYISLNGEYRIPLR